MGNGRFATRSDDGCIRIHDQGDERPAPAVMLRNGYGDCRNLVRFDARAPEGIPPLVPIEGVELVVHRAGEHRRIFERLIVPNLLRGTGPARGKPRAIIVAGAPGSVEFSAAEKALAIHHAVSANEGSFIVRN